MASTGIPGGQGDRGPARGSGAGQGARVAGQGFRGRPGGQGAGQGDRGPARGSGAGHGASMVLGREIIEMKIYCLGIIVRAPPRLGISVLYFDHFGRLFI